MKGTAIHFASVALLAGLGLAACESSAGSAASDQAPAGSTAAPRAVGQAAGEAASTEGAGEKAAAESNRGVAIFAGGCFWCMEKPFEKLEGVQSVTSGYAGGEIENPSYEQVSAGNTGHREVVRVVFDPERVSYSELLDVFWHNVDPTQDNGQFCDHGPQYRSGIFALTDEQRRLASKSKQRVEESLDEPVVTEVLGPAAFYAAEDYHQDYYEKNPIRYKFYRFRCGRDEQLEQVWGEPEH